MAYRQSHYRRGYYRRTPNGGVAWVSPTIVRGYNYEPGIIDKNGHFTKFSYSDNGCPIIPRIIDEQNSIIEEICKLFSQLDSENRKRCLDILDAFDSQLDNAIMDAQQKETEPESSADLFRYSILEDQTVRIDGYKGIGINKIIIPHLIQQKRVTQIKAAAFKDITDVEKIVLPSSITHIGDKAFQECNKLKEIVLPESWVYIGEFVFKGTSLQKIIIPTNVKHIGEACFASCESLQFAKLPTCLDTIQPDTFFNCFSLKQVIIPEGVRIISKGAFQYTSLQGEIHIPHTCTEIDLTGFVKFDIPNLPALELHIPSTVKNIKFGGNEYSFTNTGMLRKSNIIICCEPESIAFNFARDNHIPYKPYKDIYIGESEYIKIHMIPIIINILLQWIDKKKKM